MSELHTRGAHTHSYYAAHRWEESNAQRGKGEHASRHTRARNARRKRARVWCNEWKTCFGLPSFAPDTSRTVSRFGIVLPLDYSTNQGRESHGNAIPRLGMIHDMYQVLKMADQTAFSTSCTIKGNTLAVT